MLVQCSGCMRRPQSAAGAGLVPTRCASLLLAEKQWLQERLGTATNSYHSGAAFSLQTLLASRAAIEQASMDADAAQREGLRPGRIGIWLQQKAATMAQLETNIDLPSWCLEQTRTLQRKRRPAVLTADYPKGHASRIGRAPMHAQGELPRVSSAQARADGVEEETWFAASTERPSFESLVQLVEDTVREFGSCSEKRDWLSVPALTAAVGSAVCLADRDGLHQLMARSRPATTEDFARYLKAPSIGCITAGGGNGLLVLKAEKGGVQEYRASAHVLASILGVPILSSHPVRKGLEAVTGPAGRMLAGQGMDVDVVAAILRRELPELAHGAGGGGSASSRRTLHFADLFSGISFAAAAALKLRPSASRFGFAGTGRLRYRVACDAVSNVLKAHQGGWAGWVERVVQFAHSQEAVEAMRAAAPLDVAVAGIRCAPWSQAKTTPDPKDPGFKGVRERCLEESCQAIRALVAGEPRLIVLETSDWLLKGARKQYWRRLAVHLQSFVDYRWSYQVVCPRVHFSKWVPRSRLYVVGRRV